MSILKHIKEAHKKRYARGIDLTSDEWKEAARCKEAKSRKDNRKDGSVFFWFIFEEQHFQEKKLRKSAYLKEHFQEYIDILEKQGRVGADSIYNITISSLEEYKSNLRVGSTTTKFWGLWVYMLLKGYSCSIPKKHAQMGSHGPLEWQRN